MKVEDFIAKMQSDLKNEYKHMHFYLHASFVLKGVERLFAVSWFKEQAESEMGHVRQFAEKIAAFGVEPVTADVYTHPTDKVAEGKSDVVVPLADLYSLLNYALKLEREVIKNYHERLKEAHELNAKTDANYDLILFYEEHVEHSQHDIDEIVKLLNQTR